MTTKNNGGPAFPHMSRQVYGNFHQQIPDGGMTLRDYFAGQALMSMLSSPTQIGSGTPEIADDLAFKFADAMLAEREK